jgi:hypothetical protein
MNIKTIVIVLLVFYLGHKFGGNLIPKAIR